MHRLPAKSSLARCLVRSPDCPVHARAFTRSAQYSADEPQNGRPLPTRSAKAFDMIRKLPTGNSESSPPLRITRTFDNSQRSTSRDPSSSSPGPPKEVIRRPRPQSGAPTSPSRFSPTSKDRRRSGPLSSNRNSAHPGNRPARKNNRRNAFNPIEEEEEEKPEDESTADRSTYALLTSDDLIDRFTTLGEARAFAKLQDFVDDYIERAETLDEMESEAREQNKLDGKYTAALESVRKEMDEQVKEALAFASETDETALPRHEPQTVVLDAGDKGEMGGATIGKAGMANAVEEGLRRLSRRDAMQGSLFIEPRELARRLIAGDFVKFRHGYEKREILRLAENMGYKPDTAEGQQHVGFEGLSEEAKKLLVSRMVQGQYKSPAEKELGNSVLKNVARITGGNATYGSDHRATMIKTIRDLLPAQRQVGQGQKGAQRR